MSHSTHISPGPEETKCKHRGQEVSNAIAEWDEHYKKKSGRELVGSEEREIRGKCVSMWIVVDSGGRVGNQGAFQGVAETREK